MRIYWVQLIKRGRRKIQEDIKIYELSAGGVDELIDE
jgi:hypothetical protein